MSGWEREGRKISEGLRDLGISAGREAWAWFKEKMPDNGPYHGVLFWGTSLLGRWRGRASTKMW